MFYSTWEWSIDQEGSVRQVEVDQPQAHLGYHADIWTRPQLNKEIFGNSLNKTWRYLDTTSTKQGDIFGHTTSTKQGDIWTHHLNLTGRYLDTTSTEQGDIWTQPQPNREIFEQKLNWTAQIFGHKLNLTGRYLETTSTEKGHIWTQPQLNREIFEHNLN